MEIKTDIDELVNLIKFNRPALIPAYCLDGDEDERDVADYATFYAQDIEGCITSTRQYIAALAELANEQESESAWEQLFRARANYAKKFPFCDDELSGLDEQQLVPYLGKLRELYLEDLRTGFLQRTLDTYLQLLLTLRDQL